MVENSNKWDSLEKSLDMFTDDYMNVREHLPEQEREEFL